MGHTGAFTHPEGGIARNVIIFGGDMSRSVHASDKTRDIPVLGKAFVQKIESKIFYAEKMYSPNFSAENKIFVLSLHYNGDNSYLFVNGQNVTQFKANDSVISGANTRTLTLGTLTKLHPSGANNRLSPKNINDIKMYVNVYGFLVDYSSISNEEILKIHKYLMKKNGVIWYTTL